MQLLSTKAIFLNARAMARKSHVLLCILETRAGKNLTGSTRLMIPDHNTESIQVLLSEWFRGKKPQSLKLQSLFRRSVHIMSREGLKRQGVLAYDT